MNKLLEKIYARRNGHYCHCIEVSNVYDLKNIAESIIDQEEDNYDIDVIVDFLESLEVYYIDDPELDKDENKANEELVYSFSFEKYIKCL